MQLPHGAMLSKVRLSPAVGIRGSGGDLRCWFYQLAEHPRNFRRRAVGRAFTGQAASSRGLDPTRKWRCVLAVLAMGGSNSADIAQDVHQTLLLQEQAISWDDLMVYGLPMPASGLLVGIYLDDYGVMAILPKHALRSPHDRDRDTVNSIHEAYAKHSIPRAVEKGFWLWCGSRARRQRRSPARARVAARRCCRRDRALRRVRRSSRRLLPSPGGPAAVPLAWQQAPCLPRPLCAAGQVRIPRYGP